LQTGNANIQMPNATLLTSVLYNGLV